MGEIANAVGAELAVSKALVPIGSYAPIIATFIGLSLGIYFVSKVLKKHLTGEGVFSMDVIGAQGLNTISAGLSTASVHSAVNSVFGTFAGVLVGAVILTLTVYFIRKILNGANKGKARLR